MAASELTSPPRLPFIVTIDAEGDNLWARPQQALTRNAARIPRFQSLCETYGLKVCYMVDYTMAQSPVFQEFARDLLARDAGEIGMHLHAWETPPFMPSLDNDRRSNPYLTEYPKDIMRAKVHRATSLLEDIFDIPIISHRSGRFAFDERYARILAERGFLVDCSVSPHVSWAGCLGHADGNGGPDYSGFRDSAYWLDLDDISRPGASALLEAPVTVFRSWPGWITPPAPGRKREWIKQAVNRVFPALQWLYPTYPRYRPRRFGFLAAVRQVSRVVSAAEAGRTHLEFLLHSSELMPGGSPSLNSEADIDRLYEEITALFEVAARHCRSMTLSEFHSWHSRISPAPVEPPLRETGPDQRAEMGCREGRETCNPGLQ